MLEKKDPLQLFGFLRVAVVRTLVSVLMVWKGGQDQTLPYERYSMFTYYPPENYDSDHHEQKFLILRLGYDFGAIE